MFTGLKCVDQKTGLKCVDQHPKKVSETQFPWELHNNYDTTVPKFNHIW